MKTYTGVEEWLHSLKAPVLDVGEWMAKSHGKCTPGEKLYKVVWKPEEVSMFWRKATCLASTGNQSMVPRPFST
jgi:hypothetical protein